MAQEKAEMQVALKKGEWVWIEGSARIMIKKGVLECFGKILERGENLVVGRWRSISGLALKNTTLEILFGSGGDIQKGKKEHIPYDWKECVSYVNNKRGVVAILGGVDKGKSTLGVFLINHLVKEGYSVGIVDCDVGQSSIGPPCSIGWAIADKPIFWLEELKLRNAAFVGVTSPSRSKSNIIDGASNMVQEAVNAGSQIVIMDTGGWIEGEEAASFKQDLIQRCKVQTVVSLESSKDLKWIQKYSESTSLPYRQVSSPLMVRKRSIEDRRLLRARAFHRWIKDGYRQKVEFSRVRVFSMWGSLEDLQDAGINIRRVMTGVLVGLVDGNRFLGLGIVDDIDMPRRNMWLYTPIECQSTREVHISEVYLDRKGNEVGMVDPWGI